YRIKVINSTVYNLLLGCQKFSDVDQIIYNVCKFTNPLKHEGPGQHSIDTEALLIGENPQVNDGFILDYCRNVFLEGGNFSMLRLTGCDALRLFNINASKISFQSCKNIEIFGSRFNGLISDNSDVYIYNNSIINSKQHNAVMMKKNNYTIGAGSYVEANGQRFYDHPIESFPFSITSVPQRQIVVAGTDVRIVELLNHSYLKVLEFKNQLAKIL